MKYYSTVCHLSEDEYDKVIKKRKESSFFDLSQERCLK
jgi:hypothetical protein